MTKTNRNMAQTEANRASAGSPSYYDPNAIFFELSPKLVLLVRVVNVIVLLMVGITAIMCFVQAHKENGSYYLLIGNLILSGIVCIVINWWYKTGDIGSEKYWYILLVAVVILLQCIMTDIFIYKSDAVSPPHHITTLPPRPNSTVTIPWTSMRTPVTKKPPGL